MWPIIRDRWVVVDRKAVLRRDDYILFGIDDLPRYLSGARVWTMLRTNGLAKRFVGIDDERQVVMYETTNGPNRIETGLRRVTWAYRARASASSLPSALLLLLRVRRRPDAYDARIARGR